jgi:hypothetical protein
MIDVVCVIPLPSHLSRGFFVCVVCLVQERGDCQHHERFL